jgi:transposase
VRSGWRKVKSILLIRFCAKSPCSGHPGGFADRHDPDTHRFRTKRQLWSYCGLALQTRASRKHRFTGGELQASKKAPALRGLNVNHNHDPKNLFKSTAMHLGASTGPLGDFYRILLAKGMKPSMARLTLARKMAAIGLAIWKKGAGFNPEELKQQAT